MEFAWAQAFLGGICLGSSLPGIFLDDVWLKPLTSSGNKSQAMKIGCLAPVAFAGLTTVDALFIVYLLVHRIK